MTNAERTRIRKLQDRVIRRVENMWTDLPESIRIAGHGIGDVRSFLFDDSRSQAQFHILADHGYNLCMIDGAVHAIDSITGDYVI